MLIVDVAMYGYVCAYSYVDADMNGDMDVGVDVGVYFHGC